MQYNQFCPIAKASEVLGERWTLLILRELLMGGRRFGDLQRGLGLISPALLSSRLKALEAHGLVIRRASPGQRSQLYYPTPATDALMPTLIAMGEWGMVWARHTMRDADYDIDFLMFYLERSVVVEQLPGGHAVLRFRFTDLQEHADWWIIVEDGRIELCIKDPGRDVDVFLTCTVRTMHDVWTGDRSYADAIAAGDLIISGHPVLTRDIRAWLRPSVFADAPRAVA